MFHIHFHQFRNFSATKIFCRSDHNKDFTSDNCLSKIQYLSRNPVTQNDVREVPEKTIINQLFPVHTNWTSNNVNYGARRLKHARQTKTYLLFFMYKGYRTVANKSASMPYKSETRTNFSFVRNFSLDIFNSNFTRFFFNSNFTRFFVNLNFNKDFSFLLIHIGTIHLQNMTGILHWWKSSFNLHVKISWNFITENPFYKVNLRLVNWTDINEDKFVGTLWVDHFGFWPF